MPRCTRSSAISSKSRRPTSSYDQAIAKLGRVHGVINAAGVYPRKPILEITDADWDFDWGVNVKGTYNVMAAAVEHMRTQPLDGRVRGRIVNVSSVDAFKAHPKNAHYAATKAAVVSLTRSFALEFAPDQILINSIAPAGIATDKAKAAGWLPELASHTPLNRNAEPDDIAEWVRLHAVGRQPLHGRRECDRQRRVHVCVRAKVSGFRCQGLGFQGSDTGLSVRRLRSHFLLET